MLVSPSTSGHRFFAALIAGFLMISCGPLHYYRKLEQRRPRSQPRREFISCLPSIGPSHPNRFLFQCRHILRLPFLLIRPYTPLPTYTLYPTYTPVATPTPSPLSTEQTAQVASAPGPLPATTVTPVPEAATAPMPTCLIHNRIPNNF